MKSTAPVEKISVVDIDEIERKEDVEFLVGVGVSSHQVAAIGDVGYAGIHAIDLLSDLVVQDRGYDAQQIIEHSLKNAGRNTKNIPVFKYLNQCGIRSDDDYVASGLQLDKWVRRSTKEFRLRMYAPAFIKNHRGCNAVEIIERCTPENAAIFLQFLEKDDANLDIIRDFLQKNFSKMDYTGSNYASYFRKLAYLYDRWLYGW